MQKKGLQREISRYFMMLAIVPLVVVGWLILKASKAVLQRQEERHARFVAGLVAVHLEPGARKGWTGERAASLLAFVSAEIPSARWTLFAGDGRRLAGERASPVDLEVFEEALRQGAVQTRWAEIPISAGGRSSRAIVVWQPVRSAGKIQAVLELALSSEDPTWGLSKLRWAILVYAFAFSLVLVWFGYQLVHQVVVKPLREIERVAQRVAGGDVQTEVSIRGSDEIGRLSEAIESMRKRLISDQEKLADYAQSLERLNEELAEAQKALLRGEKLASVGRLAAGVAHEVGNPLGAVMGYLSLLRSLTPQEEAGDLVDRSEKELARISRIIRQLLDYARAPSQAEVCDVNDVIRATVEAVQGASESPGKRIEMELSGDLPPLFLEVDALRQVLWNLLLNGLDAAGETGQVYVRSEILSVKRLRSEPLGSLLSARMRRGDVPRPGILELRERRRNGDATGLKVTELRRKKEGLPSFLFEREGEVVRIAVEDNGSGIPTEDLGKIFDPFFTTKPVGKGTGLGLFICLNLVETMGGFLDVSSEPGKGSRFFVVLPVARTATQNLRGDPALVG